MSKAQKFTFNQDFDEPVQARPQPVETLPEPEPEPVLAPIFSEDELNAARAAAYADGERAGETRAQQSVEATIAGSLDLIADQVHQLLDWRVALERQVTADAAQLALAIATKLAGTLIARAPLVEVETLVTECLADLAEEPRVVVRLDEALAPQLAARLDALAAQTGYPGKIVVLGDERLKGADARVEWAHGGAERSAAQVIEAVNGVVGRLVAAVES
ncbi:hypothetical protein [Zavarzinia sp. CC-PAN008]|uniref:hypothetical protein n=1 Tax=Zavarzinia sp. CC-PAN008 TaxID=3243332 RepID=UPI003F743C1A